MYKIIFKSVLAILIVAVSLAVMSGALYDMLLPPEVAAVPEETAGEIEYEEQDGTVVENDESKPEEGREGKKPSVFIDAGHGGYDGGCVEDGVVEKDINLSIAIMVQEKLVASGFDVIMSRTDDTYVKKEERVNLANDAQADVFVSIHQNFLADKSVNGMEVWYDGEDVERDSRRLALLVSAQMAGNTLAVERAVKGDTDFYVTKNSKMPACLVEAGFLSNKEEREKLVSEEYQEKIASGIVQGITYYFYPKPLYLTFDDGPSPENTPRVLDILKERKLRATFFLVGENVEKYPEIVRRIAAEGHTIGIHCYNHDYRVLYRDAAGYVADFERARQAVYDAAGVDVRIFRFPGGSINTYNKKVYAGIIAEMTGRGYTYYDWNASLEDAASGIKPEKILENGVRTARKRDIATMLAHDVIYNTGIVLEKLIDSLPEYEVRPITDDVEPVQF